MWRPSTYPDHEMMTGQLQALNEAIPVQREAMLLLFKLNPKKAELTHPMIRCVCVADKMVLAYLTIIPSQKDELDV